MSKGPQHSNPEPRRHNWRLESDAELVKSDSTGSIRRWLRLADEMFHGSDDESAPSAA